jgi:DNA-binding ferritin-like protein
MKSIKVKSYNKLIEAIKLDGDTGSWNGKLKKRIVDAIRLAKECRAAAKIAREDGNDTEADWLEKRAEDYEIAAKN